MEYPDERRYVGNLSQLFDLKDFRLTGGRAEGMRATQVRNRAGLCFTVLADRCMDVCELSYRGVNLSFMTPAGLAVPAYYDPHGNGWLHSFTAGLMTTCGLASTGLPDETHGLHGRIGNTPAEEYGARILGGEKPAAELRGKMRESVLFGENFTLERTISCGYDEKSLRVSDRVTNESCRAEPLMLLYHCNMGYPLLSEESELLLPTEEITPRTPHAARHREEWRRIEPPSGDPQYEEMCYYHRLHDMGGGATFAGVYNRSLRLGLLIRFNLRALGRFVQWKNLAAGAYVLGLEPANAPIDGRERALAHGEVPFLRPGGTARQELEFQVIEGDEAFEEIKKSLPASPAFADGDFPE
jgi:hypothetical protein